MNGSPREQALAIENVEFVKHEESKRQRSAKKKRNGSDEPLLSTPPIPSPGNNVPLYDEEKGEMNPLLATSPKSDGYVMPHQLQYRHHQQYPVPSPADYYNGRGQEQYYQGGYYNGQHLPSPSQAYSPINAAMYQYDDQMAAGVPTHPIAGQQQVHSPQSHYKQQQLTPPHNHHRQQPQYHIISPHRSQHRTLYRDDPDGPEHPLKRSTHDNEEYQVPLKDALPTQSYGAIRETTTPSRSSRLRSSRPPRRKSETASNQRPPSPLSRASHRRASSDSKPSVGRHRRVSSDLVHANGSDPLHPKHRRSNSDRPPTGLAKIRKSVPFTANRRRSSSGGAIAGSRNRPSHNRASSLSEVSVGASVATSTSMVTHVTDISKSAFFGGTDKTGKVQLHFPFESVRLTMDNALPTGVLYMRHVDEEQYEDYHVFNDEQSQIPWELDGDLPCQCTCLKCIGCTERNQQLAPSEYIMTVQDDLYRRVLDEISASRSMPCGCFFCGHHDDVDSPSILIAATIVFLLIAIMGIGSFLTGA